MKTFLNDLIEELNKVDDWVFIIGFGSITVAAIYFDIEILLTTFGK